MASVNPDIEIIKDMEKEIPMIKEWAFKDYHKLLLKKWLYPVVSVLIGFFGGIVLNFFVPLPSSSIFEQFDTEAIATSIIAPSITVNGLFVTFVPVIGFFFIAEIKENQREAEEHLKAIKESFNKKEHLKVINTVNSLTHAFWHNFRVGVLRYIRSFLAVSIVSLFMQIFVYMSLSRVYFLAFELLLLISLILGVYPIISFALDKPAYKLRRYVIVPEKVLEKIEYED